MCSSSYASSRYFRHSVLGTYQTLLRCNFLRIVIVQRTSHTAKEENTGIFVYLSNVASWLKFFSTCPPISCQFIQKLTSEQLKNPNARQVFDSSNQNLDQAKYLAIVVVNHNSIDFVARLPMSKKLLQLKSVYGIVGDQAWQDSSIASKVTFTELVPKMVRGMIMLEGIS